MASQLDGVANTLKSLRALGEVSEAKALRAAVRASSKPLLREMVSRAPVGDSLHKTYKGRLVAPGFLSRSLRFIVTRVPKAGVIMAVFGARKEAFYGPSFVERGTVHQQKHSFLVDGMAAGREESLTVFAQTLREQLRRIVNKNRRMLGLKGRRA